MLFQTLRLVNAELAHHGYAAFVTMASTIIVTRMP